jgi:hypothetical protein
MARTRRFLPLGILIVALPLAACSQESAAAEPDPPAAVEEIAGSELSRITLTDKAMERLNVQTAMVEERGSRSTIPYAALIYASDGTTWTYTSPEANVFVRAEIVVDRIDGDTALLSDGPPAGTLVVTTGAAELYGTETGVGGGH